MLYKITYQRDPMAKIILYSKKGCHLCEIAREKLIEINKEISFDLREVDIEKNEEIFEKAPYVSISMNNGTMLIIPPRPKRAKAI